jgi:hypothetical protein
VVTAGVRATPGVLIVPFENEFHWSRATISFAIGINMLVCGLVGPSGLRHSCGGQMTVEKRIGRLAHAIRQGLDGLIRPPCVLVRTSIAHKACLYRRRRAV